MSMLRPILSGAVRPVVRPVTGAAADDLLFAIGLDGLAAFMGPVSSAGPVLSVADGDGEVDVLVADLAVIAETAGTVTLEFGE